MKILGIGKKPEETTWGHLEIKLKEAINFDPWGKQQEPIEVKKYRFLFDRTNFPRTTTTSISRTTRR